METGAQISKQLLGTRHCHLAALLRDDSVLNGRFRRGHTALALSLVTDMTVFMVHTTRRELVARSFVTGKTCRARATAVQVLAPLLRPCLQESTDRKSVTIQRTQNHDMYSK